MRKAKPKKARQLKVNQPKPVPACEILVASKEEKRKSLLLCAMIVTSGSLKDHRGCWSKMAIEDEGFLKLPFKIALGRAINLADEIVADMESMAVKLFKDSFEEFNAMVMAFMQEKRCSDKARAKGKYMEIRDDSIPESAKFYQSLLAGWAGSIIACEKLSHEAKVLGLGEKVEEMMESLKKFMGMVDGDIVQFKDERSPEELEKKERYLKGGQEMQDITRKEIIEFREEKGWDLKQMAKALGIRKSALEKIEAGEQKVSAAVKAKHLELVKAEVTALEMLRASEEQEEKKESPETVSEPQEELPTREGINDTPKVEEVHSPKHYEIFDGVEAIHVMRVILRRIAGGGLDPVLAYNIGNALKYLLRAGKKGNAVTDYRKAAKSLDYIIEDGAGDVKGVFSWGSLAEAVGIPTSLDMKVAVAGETSLRLGLLRLEAVEAIGRNEIEKARDVLKEIVDELTK